MQVSLYVLSPNQTEVCHAVTKPNKRPRVFSLKKKRYTYYKVSQHADTNNYVLKAHLIFSL